MASRFMNFCEDYSEHFVARGRNSVDHARGYMSGLLGRQRRKNMETISWDVDRSDYQGIEQFISSSSWDEKALLSQLAKDANRELGADGAGLYIDETSFVKKGKSSVGVKRQYCGRLGKLENCQVGVFACLGRRRQCVPVDFRLFLPEDWAEDPERCAKAGVPEDRRSHKTKLKFRFWSREVWTWEPAWKKPRRRLLLIRQNEDASFKYSLSNFSSETSWETLAYMQAQRFWIEHGFHEAKSQLGMAQYQVRVWRGWHHHMALICLACLFVVKEQRIAKEEMPLLTARDITELLDIYLPRRERTEGEIYRQIRERHRSRKKDLERRRDKTIGLHETERSIH